MASQKGSQKKKMFRKSDTCTICGQAVYLHSYPVAAEHEVAADLLHIPATVRNGKDMAVVQRKIQAVYDRLV